MIRGSVEYLEFTLSDRDGADLSADTVQASLLAAPDDDPTWLSCTYVAGTTWRTTDVITWGDTYPLSSYHAYAKISDNPEVPLCSLGWVNIEDLA